MSYAPRKNRADSKDVIKLRREYDDKARQVRETKDAASREKLREDKQKLFQKVVAQIDGERGESLAEEHKVLTRMGRLKSKEQVEAERAALQAQQAGRRQNEGR